MSSVRTSGLEAGLEKMRNAAMPEAALKAFAYYYEQLRDPGAGM